MSKAVLSSLFAVSTLLLTATAAHAGECTVEARPGVSEDDREGVDQLLCSQLRSEAPGNHQVRLAKLGTKLIVTVFTQSGAGPSEHQVILQNIDELSVAAPRLVAAAADQKPIADTLQVNNVLNEDARVPKKKAAEIHAWLSVVGIGIPSLGVGPGAALALSGGNDRWSFIGEGRIAGIDRGHDSKPTMVLQLSGGLRHHFTSSDISPFVGVGASVLMITEANDGRSRVVVNGRDVSANDSRTGLAGGLEAGLDILRTNTVGGAIILRADLPAFSAATDTGPGTPILSAGLAMRF